MLSILIPIYNQDIRALARDLHGQCTALETPFEILCFDDGSSKEFLLINRELAHRNGIVYEELPQNLGRAAIRNRLAARAQYDYLLFMDGDSGVVSDHYLKNYVAKRAKGTLIYGGTYYRQEPPADREKYLHWKYGRKREQIPASIRGQKPYHSFKTNNFYMARSDFMAVKFDERISRYGHEDTLFGLQAKAKNLAIVHIENPLEHLGLEKNTVFLAKQQEAVENLWQLHRSGPGIETRLLTIFYAVRRSGSLPLMSWAFQKISPLLKKNLLSRNPSLFLLDLFKLHLLIQVASHSEKPH